MRSAVSSPGWQRQSDTVDKSLFLWVNSLTYTLGDDKISKSHSCMFWTVGARGRMPRGPTETGSGWGTMAGYLVGCPGCRLVLVVGEDEERQCAELRVLQGGMELVAGSFEILVWRSTVQDEDHALWALVVTTPVLLDVISPCGRHKRCLSKFKATTLLSRETTRTFLSVHCHFQRQSREAHQDVATWWCDCCLWFKTCQSQSRLQQTVQHIWV